MTETLGKLIFVRVSARFELAGVRVIGIIIRRSSGETVAHV